MIRLLALLAVLLPTFAAADASAPKPDRRCREAPTSGLPLHSVLLGVQYGPAEDLAKQLAPYGSLEGSIESVPFENTLILTDHREHLSRLLELAAMLDVPDAEWGPAD